ncbi:MAG: hypothetical protein K5752_07885 [Succinivibrionaceae bacterium]|jgi:uncharacterized membrane protein YhaH (DUF805 family)|nr:hypothetical protein [Succinivibrionaceae bacterium]
MDENTEKLNNMFNLRFNREDDSFSFILYNRDTGLALIFKLSYERRMLSAQRSVYHKRGYVKVEDDFGQKNAPLAKKDVIRRDELEKHFYHLIDSFNLDIDDFDQQLFSRERCRILLQNLLDETKERNLLKKYTFEEIKPPSYGSSYDDFSEIYSKVIYNHEGKAIYVPDFDEEQYVDQKTIFEYIIPKNRITGDLICFEGDITRDRFAVYFIVTFIFLLVPGGIISIYIMATGADNWSVLSIARIIMLLIGFLIIFSATVRRLGSLGMNKYIAVILFLIPALFIFSLFILTSPNDKFKRRER